MRRFCMHARVQSIRQPFQRIHNGRPSAAEQKMPIEYMNLTRAPRPKVPPPVIGLKLLQILQAAPETVAATGNGDYIRIGGGNDIPACAA